MFRPLEIFIGLRYLLPKRGTLFVSFVSLASLFGIGLGVAALIVILSIMNGFENELRGRLVSMTSHATVTADGGRLEDWRSVVAAAESREGIRASTPFVDIQAMLVKGADLSPALVRGVDPVRERSVSAISANMLTGSLDDLASGSGNIVLGKVLALKVGARAGGRVTVLVPTAAESGTGIEPKLRRFTVSGIFEVGIQEHDGVLALVHLDDAARLAGLGSGVTGVRLAMDEIFAAPGIVSRLVDDLGEGYESSDWTRENAGYFRAIKIEKTMMSLILLLIVGVALFNIIATLVMVVAEKRNDIAILRTIGLKPGSVVGVFMTQGIIVGWLGVAIGVLGGVLISVNVGTIVPALENLVGANVFDPSVYYISQIPSDVHVPDVLWISVTAFVLSALATVYPARRAARTDPAVALRYE